MWIGIYAMGLLFKFTENSSQNKFHIKKNIINSNMDIKIWRTTINVDLDSPGCGLFVCFWAKSSQNGKIKSR